MNAIIRRYSSVMHGNYRWAGVKYGVVMAAGLCFSLFLRYILGHPANAPIAKDETWVVFIGLILMSLVLVFHYRRNLTEKKISFKEGFLVSFYACLVACVIYAVFMYGYTLYIDNSALDSFHDRTIDVMTRTIAASEHRDIDSVVLPEMPYLVMWGMVLNMVMSILVAFITGIICRNEKKQLHE